MTYWPMVDVTRVGALRGVATAPVDSVLVTEEVTAIGHELVDTALLRLGEKVNALGIEGIDADHLQREDLHITVALGHRDDTLQPEATVVVRWDPPVTAVVLVGGPLDGERLTVRDVMQPLLLPVGESDLRVFYGLGGWHPTERRWVMVPS